MRRLVITILFLLLCLTVSAQSLSMNASGSLMFGGVTYDTSLLPEDTFSMFHFDFTENYGDLSDRVWTFTTKDFYSDVAVNSTGGKFKGSLYDSTGTAADADAWWLTATETYAIATGDYSIEFWFNPGTGSLNLGNSFNAFYVRGMGLQYGNYSPVNLFFFNDGDNKWSANPGYATDTLSASTHAMDGDWWHYCIERYSGNVTLYINGSVEASTTAALGACDLSAATSWQLGRDSSAGAGLLNDWKIDELKISSKAIYKGAFTPQIAPYGREYQPTLAMNKDTSLEPIAGLAAWYDASDLSTIATFGSVVTQLDDKSGNGNHAVASVTFGPMTGVSSQNGLNVLSFSSSNYLIANAAATPIGSTPCTIYVVFYSISGLNRAIISGGGDTDNTGVEIVKYQSTSAYFSLISSGGYYAVATNCPHGAYHYGTGWANTTQTKLRIDGTEFTRTRSKNTSALPFYIGACHRNLTNGINGYIGEILIYHAAHDAAQMLENETYLKMKWGL